MPRWARYTAFFFVGSLVVANLITGLIWERSATNTEGELCFENLHRIATALALYAAKHSWLYPSKITNAKDPQTHNPLKPVCPVSGARIDYIGNYIGGFLWDVPRGVPLVWCTSPHVYIEGGEKDILVVTADGVAVRWDPGSFAFFLNQVKRLVEKRKGQFEICRLALGGSMVSLQQVGWMLLAEAVRREGLSDEVAKLLTPLAKKSHFEAARIMAIGGSDVGAKCLVDALKSYKFRRRLRAILALRELTGGDFGFRPELPPKLQKEPLEKWMNWLKTH